jgi:hypothetical protein
MKWFMAALVVTMLFTVMLLPAECHARGFFSFFNPEVEVPVEVKPVNSDISGMKNTITLGSLGSVITAHLALVIMGFLLYASIRRLGGDYHQRNYLVRAQRIASRIERLRLRGGKRGWFSWFRKSTPAVHGESLAQLKPVTVVLDCSQYRNVLARVQAEVDRLEALFGSEKAETAKKPEAGKGTRSR